MNPTKLEKIKNAVEVIDGQLSVMRTYIEHMDLDASLNLEQQLEQSLTLIVLAVQATTK